MVAVLIPASPAFANLGATPQECAKAYGEPKFEKDAGTEIDRGYQPTFEGFSGAIVMAAFKKGTVTSIRYRIRDQKDFTPEQFAFLASLNGLGLKKKFVEVGYTPDRSKHIWATEDNSAYLVVWQGQSLMDLMTRAEAIDIIKLLPSK